MKIHSVINPYVASKDVKVFLSYICMSAHFRLVCKMFIDQCMVKIYGIDLHILMAFQETLKITIWHVLQYHQWSTLLIIIFRVWTKACINEHWEQQVSMLGNDRLEVMCLLPNKLTMLGWENFFIKSASSMNLLITVGSLLVSVFTATGIFPLYPAIPCRVVTNYVWILTFTLGLQS